MKYVIINFYGEILKEVNIVPAYFNISIQFQRKNIYKTFVHDFYSHLKKCGFKFLSGFSNESEKEYSFEEIIFINQRKLEENFELGFDEDCSNDYRQIYYSLDNFSETRGFWLNNYPDNEEFTYEIIIPESELKTQVVSSNFDKEKILRIIKIAEKIWEFQYVRAIQTGLEENDAIISLSELKSGTFPNCFPFAITEENSVIDKPFKTEEINGLHSGYIFWNESLFFGR